MKNKIKLLIIISICIAQSCSNTKEIRYEVFKNIKSKECPSGWFYVKDIYLIGDNEIGNEGYASIYILESYENSSLVKIISPCTHFNFEYNHQVKLYSCELIDSAYNIPVLPQGDLSKYNDLHVMYCEVAIPME